MVWADLKGLAMLSKSVMNLDDRTTMFYPTMPLTFMNDFVTAVTSTIAYIQIEPVYIVVYQKDTDSEFGRIMVKPGGSAGVNISIKRTARSLVTLNCARVRMGVGHSRRRPNAQDNTVNRLLGVFGSGKHKQVPEWLAHSANSAEVSIFHDTAMTPDMVNSW